MFDVLELRFSDDVVRYDALVFPDEPSRRKAPVALTVTVGPVMRQNPFFFCFSSSHSSETRPSKQSNA